MTATHTPGNPSRLTDELVERIATVAHECNAAYCRTIGDNSQPRWEDAPDWQRSSAADGVRAIAEGRITAPQDSHANWFAHKQREGWRYGPTKNPETKEHPCMVPFAELPPEQQAKDRLFFGVVQALL